MFNSWLSQIAQGLEGNGLTFRSNLLVLKKPGVSYKKRHTFSRSMRNATEFDLTPENLWYEQTKTDNYALWTQVLPICWQMLINTDCFHPLMLLWLGIWVGLTPSKAAATKTSKVSVVKHSRYLFLAHKTILHEYSWFSESFSSYGIRLLSYGFAICYSLVGLCYHPAERKVFQKHQTNLLTLHWGEPLHIPLIKVWVWGRSRCQLSLGSQALWKQRRELWWSQKSCSEARRAPAVLRRSRFKCNVQIEIP